MKKSLVITGVLALLLAASAPFVNATATPTVLDAGTFSWNNTAGDNSTQSWTVPAGTTVLIYTIGDYAFYPRSCTGNVQWNGVSADYSYGASGNYNDDDDIMISVWKNPATGTHNFTVTCSTGSNTGALAYSVALKDTAASPIGANYAGSGSYTTSLTLQGATGLVYDIMTPDCNGTLTAGGGQTTYLNGNPPPVSSIKIAGGWKATAGGTQTIGYTSSCSPPLSSQDLILAGVEIKGAAAATGWWHIFSSLF